MIFATSCYGQHFAPCLAVCLRILRQQHSDASVLVIHDGLPRQLVRALAANNPNTAFRQCEGLDFRDEVLDFAVGESVTVVDAAAIGDPSGEHGDKWAALLQAEEEEIGVSLLPLRYRLAGALRFAFNRQPLRHP